MYDRPRRRLPLGTIALMLAAGALPFVYSATAGDGALMGWVLVGSPALGAIGAVVAWRSRGLRATSRSRWAVASVLTGLSTVPLVAEGRRRAGRARTPDRGLPDSYAVRTVKVVEGPAQLPASSHVE